MSAKFHKLRLVVEYVFLINTQYILVLKCMYTMPHTYGIIASSDNMKNIRKYIPSYGVTLYIAILRHFMLSEVKSIMW
jgi:hypothetical protein